MSKSTKTKLIIGLVVLVIVIVVCSIAGLVVYRATFLGSGKLVRESRDVSGFDSIVLDGVGEIILTQQGPEKMEIEAEDNIMPQLTTEVKNNTLTISIRKVGLFMILPTQSVKYYINVKNIRNITISGSGSVKSDRLQSQEMTLKVIGSGKFEIDLFADKLTTDVSGQGDVILSGNVSELYSTINGTGMIDAENTRAANCTAIINGSGKITVNCRSSLNTQINGNGEVYYFGTPQITQQISGTGKIENIGGGKKN